MKMFNDDEYNRLKELKVELKHRPMDHVQVEGMMNCGMICVGSMSLEELEKPSPFNTGGWETEEQYKAREAKYNDAPKFEEAMSRILSSLLNRMCENGMIVFSDSIQEPLGDDGGDFREIGMRHLAEYIMRNRPHILHEGPVVWNNGGDGFIQHWTITCSDTVYDNYADVCEDSGRKRENECDEEEGDDYY